MSSQCHKSRHSQCSKKVRKEKGGVEKKRQPTLAGLKPNEIVVNQVDCVAQFS